ncbi:MAG: AAA family ATPase, partial [Deinococcota bacterium]
MKISSIKAKNFRSLMQIEMNDLADLNSIVGKNNSGKSNLLNLIEIIFLVVGSGKLILGMDLDDTDFWNGDSDEEICIEATFELSTQEAYLVSSHIQKMEIDI